MNGHATIPTNTHTPFNTPSVDAIVSNNTNAQIHVPITIPCHTPFQIPAPAFNISSSIDSLTFLICSFKLSSSTASMISQYLPNASLMLITSFSTESAMITAKGGNNAPKQMSMDMSVVTMAIILLR